MSVSRARELAELVYEGRVDRRDYPEIDHARAVAEGVSNKRWRAVAWVHDTVEDGLLPTLLFYREMDAAQFEALLLLTRDKASGLSYMQYITQIKEAKGEAGAIARAVKRSDVRHNLRRPGSNTRDEKRRTGGRYDQALRILG